MFICSPAGYIEGADNNIQTGEGGGVLNIDRCTHTDNGLRLY
jgi:hypothetical protein